MDDSGNFSTKKFKSDLNIIDTEGHIDTAKLKKRFAISNFDLNAFIRGLQITLVGVNRAMQNSAIFDNEHYRQAATAFLIGLAIHVAILIPVYALRLSLWILSFVISLDTMSWDDYLTTSLTFLQKFVLQVPFLVMSLLRFLTPTLDNLFMDSLAWVDKTYSRMHARDDPDTLRKPFYEPLRNQPPQDSRMHSTRTADGLTSMLARHGKKAVISLAIYAASYVPYIGRVVLPSLSFITFKTAVGPGPAVIVFAFGLFLPKAYLVHFLQTYYSSRSLVRELLDPYFARIHFTAQQKRKWFRSREGLLFGFGVGFWTLIQVPLFGVLMYGIAEASAAYLVTKITDPVPEKVTEGWIEGQLVWKNKQKFLSLPMGKIDAVLDKVELKRRKDKEITNDPKNE